MAELSIIIPHYNSVNTLVKLLDSIPVSKKIQVLVIDDNSTKDLQKLQSLKSKYSNVHFLKNNTSKKGAGACRNIGIDNSVGRWILFADADDFFIDGFYECLKPYLMSNYDVVFFKPTSLDTETGEKSNRHIAFQKLIENYQNIGDRTSELQLRYCFDVPWSKLISSKIIKENRLYFDEVIASNDVMFSAKLGYYMNKFETSSETIYCVTRSSGSLTTNISTDVFDVRLKVYIDYKNFLENKLSKNDLEKLKVTGLIMIVNVLKYRMGLKKLFSVIWILKKNRFPLFDKRLLNPFFILKKLTHLIRDNKVMKKYYIK